MTEGKPAAVQYFAIVADGETAETAIGLVRRKRAEPLLTAEYFGRDLSWHPTEYLYRYYYLGSNDRDHVEVSAEAAEKLMERWRSRRQDPPGRAGG